MTTSRSTHTLRYPDDPRPLWQYLLLVILVAIAAVVAIWALSAAQGDNFDKPQTTTTEVGQDGS